MHRMADFGGVHVRVRIRATGLGRRIALILVKRMGARSLTLGYGVALADTVRSFHTVQYRAQWRHHLFDHSQFAADLPRASRVSRQLAFPCPRACVATANRLVSIYASFKEGMVGTQI